MKLAFFEEAVKHIERLRRPFRPTACCWMMRGLRSSRSTTGLSVDRANATNGNLGSNETSS